MDKITILLVDDDDDDQLFFNDAVQEAHHLVQLFTANNGLDAIQMLNQNPLLVDAIFMDINMPLQNGFDCLAIIKKNTCLQHIPVIMLSTSSQSKDIQHALQLGATRFISKSQEYVEYKTNIKNVLDEVLCKRSDDTAH
ncbi:response regulator [Deminuibacter soli]|uniref:response regulator n=1 Tax=Deminuibacter soli TaxID=2291815 RepID=UPI0013142EAB|nr:response regulator [Deminuibacter soli]